MNRYRFVERARFAGSAGYSLIEVVVAMLITCVMVTAVMGVAVTAKKGSVKGVHDMMFDQGISQLSAEVKQYVTGCGCAESGGCPSSSCAEPPVGIGMHGPNMNRSGAATWYLNGAPGAPPVAGAPCAGGVICDSAGDVWALACGTPHVITGVVPMLEAPPYNGTISYTVTWPSGCSSSPPAASDSPMIVFTANWTEP